MVLPEVNGKLCRLKKDYWKFGTEVIIKTLDNKLSKGTISSLPFSK